MHEFAAFGRLLNALRPSLGHVVKLRRPFLSLLARILWECSGGVKTSLAPLGASRP